MGDVSGICAKISFSVELFLAGKLQNIESKLNKMTYEVIRKTFWSDMKVTENAKKKTNKKLHIENCQKQHIEDLYGKCHDQKWKLLSMRDKSPPAGTSRFSCDQNKKAFAWKMFKSI